MAASMGTIGRPSVYHEPGGPWQYFVAGIDGCSCGYWECVLEPERRKAPNLPDEGFLVTKTYL
jgi:hypothetical protein